VLLRDECHLWAVRVDEALAGGEARFLSWLSAEERARIDRFRFEKDRRQHLVSRALARAALSRYTGVDPAAWAFTDGPQGKPRVDRPAPAFNLAHAGELVVCALVNAGDVGVDVERISDITDPTALAETACSPGERAHLESLPPAARAAHFAALFTIKEAYLKARGVGLAEPLDRITVTLDPDRLAFSPPIADDPRRWQIARLTLEDYQIAVARDGELTLRLQGGFP
jgi:4'-phosphopantetheinyl transferase